jgi:hypothetical protein
MEPRNRFRGIDSAAYVSFAGIFKQSMGARNQIGIGLSYRPARLHRLTELMPWNRSLACLNIYEFRLWRAGTTNRVVVPAPAPGWESIPGLLNRFTNTGSGFCWWWYTCVLWGEGMNEPHLPSPFYNWARICKPFKEPRNQSPAWRPGTITLLDVLARQVTFIPWNRFLGSLNVYKYGSEPEFRNV